MKKLILILTLAFVSQFGFAQDCEYCFGATQTITVNEGTSWIWSTTETTQTITVTTGTYTVTVTDAGGCTGEGTYVVAECPELTAACSGVDNTDCTTPNGSVTVTPAGGCGTTYSYVWTSGGSPIGTTQTVNGLAAGTYTVLVTDETGCSGTCDVTIADDPTDLTVTFTCN